MAALHGDTDGFRECWMSAQDGLRLYYRDYGDPLSEATPLLCLSGISRNSKDFHDVAVRLSGQRRVVCPDYRGRGRSSYDPDWRHYVPRTYLNDLLHLLAAANLPRVVVCGTSLGGFLAMGLALVSPGSLAGAILNDVGPEVRRDGLAYIAEYVGRAHRFADWDGALRHVKETYAELGYTEEARWRRFTEATFRLNGAGVLVNDWDTNIAKTFGAEMPDLWPLFRALRKFPTLALRGEASSILSSETFARMGHENPGLLQVTVAGSGHAPALNEDEAETAIDDFLTRLDSAHRGH